MSAPASPIAGPAWLCEPTYGYAAPDGRPRRPTTREVFTEWLDAIDVRRDGSRAVPAVSFAFHATTGVLFLLSFATMTRWTLLYGVLVHQVVSLVYHTFWYHRYCSHGAFRFSSPWFTRFFLWTNPVFIREETYCIPHRIHHQRSDLAGDPYGPHLGWLGSYLAWESLYKVNRSIGPRDYETLQRSLSHVGFPMNDHAAYQRTGSVERLWHFWGRTAVAQIVFAAVGLLAGGLPFLLAGYGGLFVFTALLRDFPWRGHGGNFRDHKIPGWEFDTRSRSLNNRFYGVLAGEWHDNHHRFPTSANSAFLAGQIDIVFLLVKLLHRAGIVRSYQDASGLFRERVLMAPPSAEPAGPAFDGSEAVALEK